MGKVTQFLRFERQGSTSIPILELKLLQNILKKSKKKKLAFVSSCGSARQGKSFILNFILRCILKQAKDEDNFLDWDQSDQPLEGFAWANGEDQVTQGIWITNKPTILKNTMDEEVAIFLIDTQGIFDEYSTLEESRIILGISLLLSTTTIFSMKAELHEEKIAAIANVINFFHDKFPNQEFGGLILLIKDWMVRHDYTHGEQGGSKYLKNRLTVSSSHSAESKLARIVLQEHLSEVNAFLMPHPGEKATKSNFTGSLNEILPKYSKELEVFLLSPKLLNLEFARTWSTVLEDLDAIVSVFNPSGTVELPTQAPHLCKRAKDGASGNVLLNDHTVSIDPTEMVKCLVSEYTSKLNAKICEGGMTVAELDRLHKQLYESVTAKFQPDEKYSYKENKPHHDNLLQLLDKAFTKVQDEIATIGSSVEESLNSISADVLSEYQEQLKNIPCTWTSEDKVTRFTSLKVKKLMDIAIQQFLSKSTDFQKDLVKHKEQRLKNSLQAAFDKQAEELRSIQQKKEFAEFEYMKLEFVNEYRKTMKKWLPNTDPENRLAFHEKYVAFKFSRICITKPAYSENLKQTFELEFQRIIQGFQIGAGHSSLSENFNQLGVEIMDDCIKNTGREPSLPTSVKDDGCKPSAEANETFQPKVEDSLQMQNFQSENPGDNDLKNVLEQFSTKCNREFDEIEIKMNEAYKEYMQRLAGFRNDIKSEFITKINGIHESTQSEDELPIKYTTAGEELLQKLRSGGLKLRLALQEADPFLKVELDNYCDDLDIDDNYDNCCDDHEDNYYDHVNYYDDDLDQEDNYDNHVNDYDDDRDQEGNYYYHHVNDNGDDDLDHDDYFQNE